MKKIFAFLLLGLTVAFASCGDEKTEPGTDWFLTPVAEVNGTTVGLSCQTRFGEGVLENTSVGFSYAAIVDNKIGAFADVAGSAVDGTGIAATLTGLQPETNYLVFAYAGLSTGRVQSQGAVFKTGQDDMPDPDPERPAFGTPAASGVTKTEATLNCTFYFGDTADYDVYFRYKPASSGSYDRVNVSTGTGTKTAALTGMTPGTTYEFALCADWGGQTYTSAAATFTTSSDGGGGGGDQNKDQNQDQNKDQNQNDQSQQNPDQKGDQKDQKGDPKDQQGDQKQNPQEGKGDQEEQDDQQGQPTPSGISPQEQQQMLDAIQAQEDKTQEKLKEKQGVVVRGKKNW